MKILFLGYDKKKTSLINFLEKRGHKVKHTLDKVNDFSAYDFVISFGYQHIIKKFSTLARPIINLHIITNFIHKSTLNSLATFCDPK